MLPEGFVLTCIALLGIGQCTALQDLNLYGCEDLQSLPESESHPSRICSANDSVCLILPLQVSAIALRSRHSISSIAMTCSPSQKVSFAFGHL